MVMPKHIVWKCSIELQRQITYCRNFSPLYKACIVHPKPFLHTTTFRIILYKSEAFISKAFMTKHGCNLINTFIGYYIAHGQPSIQNASNVTLFCLTFCVLWSCIVMACFISDSTPWRSNLYPMSFPCWKGWYQLIKHQVMQCHSMLFLFILFFLFEKNHNEAA
jgi:hypothetical protein